MVDMYDKTNDWFESKTPGNIYLVDKLEARTS